MGESLRETLHTLTRYSANEPNFPVNDLPLFTGQISRKAAYQAGRNARWAQ